MSRVLALVAALLVGAVPARGQTPDKPNPVYIQPGTASVACWMLSERKFSTNVLPQLDIMPLQKP